MIVDPKAQPQIDGALLEGLIERLSSSNRAAAST
jgi:hypothetical protein